MIVKDIGPNQSGGDEGGGAFPCHRSVFNAVIKNKGRCDVDHPVSILGQSCIFEIIAPQFQQLLDDVKKPLDESTVPVKEKDFRFVLRQLADVAGFVSLPQAHIAIISPDPNRANSRIYRGIAEQYCRFVRKTKAIFDKSVSHSRGLYEKGMDSCEKRTARYSANLVEIRRLEAIDNFSFVAEKVVNRLSYLDTAGRVGFVTYSLIRDLACRHRDDINSCDDMNWTPVYERAVWVVLFICVPMILMLLGKRKCFIDHRKKDNDGITQEQKVMSRQKKYFTSLEEVWRPFFKRTILQEDTA